MTARGLAIVGLLVELVEAVEAEPEPYRIGNGVIGCPTYEQHKAHLLEQARRNSRPSRTRLPR